MITADTLKVLTTFTVRALYRAAVDAGYKDMTPDEVEAYHAGYEDNEDSGDHKEWL